MSEWHKKSVCVYPLNRGIVDDGIVGSYNPKRKGERERIRKEERTKENP